MKEWNGTVPNWELEPKNLEGIKNWQDEATEKSGIKVPDLKLESNDWQDEVVKESVRKAPEHRKQEEVKESTQNTTEVKETDSERKSRQDAEKIKAIRAEFEEMGFSAEVPVPNESPVASREQSVIEEGSIKKEFGVMGKASVFVKKMFRMELTPEEKKYHIERLTDDFDKLIAEGAFTKAYKQYDKVFKEKGSHDVHCEEEIKDTMLKSVAGGDGRTFARLLKLNEEHGLALTPMFMKEELGLKEHEMVNPEIAQVAIDSFYRQLKDVADRGMVNLVDWYENRSESWIESGVVSPEALSHAPGVKKVIQEDIIRTAKRMFSKSSEWGNPVEKFDEYLEQIEEAGILPKAEVWKWEEVQSIIHR
jgi:hypothetical protein